MAIDRATLQLLKKFATAFREARERNANESDTVMYLVKFCEEVFGYDPLRGEISKEVAIRDRYCDMALKIEGDPRNWLGKNFTFLPSHRSSVIATRA